ncbi:MAG: hypothetical protein FWF29_07055, partial [Treponema sp.]|nr:hypothetical protein [Treponema sp.]
DTVMVTATPSPGYELASLYYNAGAGNITIDTGIRNFSMPASNVTVGGTFALASLNLTSSVTPAGAGSVAFTNKGNGSTATGKMGDTVTVGVSANSGYRLKANGVTYVYTGAAGQQAIQLSPPYSFTMPAYSTEVRAAFDPLYTVAGTVSPSGAGSVSFTDSNGAAATQFAAGDIVTVSAAPGTGYRLDTISVSGSVVISGSTFTMPASGVTVTAAFTKQVYSISILPSNNGDISAVPSSATMSEQVNLSMQSAPGYKALTLEYKRSTDPDTAYQSVFDTQSFQMPPGNVTVRGSFGLQDLALSQSINPAGGGTITLTPLSTARLGDTVTVSVAAAAGYRLADNGVKYSYTDENNQSHSFTLSGSSPYTFTMPAYNVTVSADFVRLYTVTCTITPAAGGSALIRVPGGSEANQFASGDQVEIIAESSVGYLFSSITVNGQAASNIFQMPAMNTSVTVTFTKETYTISVQKPDNGDISSSRLSASMGDTVTLTVQASPGYELRSGSLSAGDGVDMAMNGYPDNSGGRPTFVMPARNVTISSVFDKKNLNLSAVAVPTAGGIVTLSPPAIAQTGDPVTVTVTPASSPDKYRIKSSGYRTVTLTRREPPGAQR